MNKTILALITIAIGATLPIQAALNGKLMRAFGHPVIGAAISFLTGTILLLTYASTLHKHVTLEAVKQTVWFDWIGGIIGVLYVTGSIMLIPRLGAGFAFALMVGGQLLMSLIMDHYGMLGLNVSQVSWSKIGGVVLVVAGVWLIRGK
jgi:bacterial/archaeal transporter family-2 protein